MPDLLLELFSEEIPARMQQQASEDLRKLVTNALVERGLTYEGAGAFATPRRLALHIAGLPARQPDTREEKKGPRVGAPDAAVQGFLKSAGLSSLDQAKIEKDPKGKGEFYVAVIERAGRDTKDVLADILPAIIRTFPWPKSMRWGASSSRSDALRWVRPLHSIVCTFGPETEEPEVIDFEVDGVRSGNVTYGHRFLAPAAIRVRRFDDYVTSLEAAKVVLDPARRRDIILNDAKNLAFAQGLELVEDEGLLHEVAGLVEWPVALMGEFDEAFLAIPPEVVRATIRANQKCFVLRRGISSPPVGEDQGGGTNDRAPASSPTPPTPTLPHKGGGSSLTNKFILVSNIIASDDGKAIAAGNGRVVRARLSDALYFWETDQAALPDYVNDENRKLPLDQRLAKLRALNIVFHEKLGTQGERIDRIMALAQELAPLVGADPKLARRAAELCKADLTTEVVGEFPEVQGLMGRRYAELQGEHPDVCAAIEEHYKPQGPGDRVPTNPVSIAVALADKLDTLVGFWAIDEKPTGSKDPYALRRAALGVIRIVLENEKKISISSMLPTSTLAYLLHGFAPKDSIDFNHYQSLFGERGEGSHVTIGDWWKRPFSLYLNYDGLIDQYGKVIGEIELSIEDEPSDAEISAYRLLKARLEAMDACTGAFVFAPLDGPDDRDDIRRYLESRNYDKQLWHGAARQLLPDLLSFFHDRLKVYLRDQGARHDLIDAVLALGAGVPSPLVGEGQGGDRGAQRAPTLTLPHKGGGNSTSNDDLLMIVRRVEALGKFLDSEDGKSLLAGYKRAANILRAEEKKDGAGAFNEKHAPNLRSAHAENILASAVDTASRHAAEHVANEDFEAAMRALARLRAPVDAFFTDVTVNDENPRVRKNRLQLLNELRSAMHTVADFSKIQG